MNVLFLWIYSMHPSGKEPVESIRKGEDKPLSEKTDLLLQVLAVFLLRLPLALLSSASSSCKRFLLELGKMAEWHFSI